MGGTFILVRRRLRRDLAQVVGMTGVVALASLLALGLPRLFAASVDDGAREAISAAGPDADLVVQALVGESPASTPTLDAHEVVALAAELPSLLPESLTAVTDSVTFSVVSPESAITVDDGADRGAVSATVALVSATDLRGLHPLTGTLPATDADSGAVEVIVSRAAADLALLDVGSRIRLPDAVGELTVVGIVEPPDAAAPPVDGAWVDLPTMWSPSGGTTRRGVPTASITLLTDTEGALAAARMFEESLTASLRVQLDPQAFDSERAAAVAEEIAELTADGSSLAGSSRVPVRVDSGFGQALDPFVVAARSAVAHMSLMVTGVLAVALVAIALVSRLLVLRRAREVALERARGATLPSVALRVFAESALASVAGGAIGVAAAAALVPGGPTVVLPLAVVVAFAAVAPALLTVARFGIRGRVRRAPANRSDRAEIASTASRRRLVVEVALLALAAWVMFAVRSRGLAPVDGGEVDLLLASAPPLLAAASAALLLRLFPLVMRAAARIARRSTGAAGVLAAAHAERSASALPLFALTLAVTLSVSGAMLLDTVRLGQVDAAWQAVGADVRVEGALSQAEFGAVATAAGVSAASSIRVLPSVDLDGGTSSANVTVLAIDDGYADVAAQLPLDDAADADADALASLAGMPVDGDTIPVLVDQRLADRFAEAEIMMVIDDTRVRVHVAGTVRQGPTGYLRGPFVYVERALLARGLGSDLPPTTMLAMGSGADDAVATIDSATTLTREGWLDDHRDRALVSGVERMMATSTLATGLFAVLALIASVLAGSRARGRSLSLLATLGMRRRFGMWLVAAEIGPLVGAAVLGGVAAGVAIAAGLSPALELQALAGGHDAPEPTLAAGSMLALAAGTMALVAAGLIAEVLAHRRERMSETLRVGDPE